MSDLVNHPAHYQGKVECIDCLEAATEGLNGIEAVCTANAIKYLYRWKKKNGVTDLKKSIWYIEKLIKVLESPELTEKYVKPIKSEDDFAEITKELWDHVFGKMPDLSDLGKSIAASMDEQLAKAKSQKEKEAAEESQLIDKILDEIFAEKEKEKQEEKEAMKAEGLTPEQWEALIGAVKNAVEFFKSQLKKD